MLARAHKKFERRQHTELYLVALKAQDEGKIELPWSGEFFPSNLPDYIKNSLIMHAWLLQNYRRQFLNVEMFKF
jgi:hypothetical protein